MKSSKIKQMFYKLENPETFEKYRAYLDLLRVLKDILRSNGCILPHGIEGYKINADRDSKGNLTLDLYYRRRPLFSLHLRYGRVQCAELPLFRLHRPIRVSDPRITSILNLVDVLQTYDDVSERPIFWDFTGIHKQLKSKYICSDGITRYEKL
jgi:hypothetical protein